MKTRRLGNQGLTVSAVGYGAMPLSDFYDDPSRRDDKEGIATIKHAIDIGVTFLDTADMYGSGHNERLVGEAIRGRRDEVVLATKFGVMRGAQGEFLGINGKPAYVRQQCEASLKHLGVETIDLYYQHRVDDSVPIEETVGAMADLVKEGKVRFLGLSEAGVETMRRAVKVHPISALQTEYSLWTRDPEAEHLAACRELGIGFVAYSPLGRGFLTGSIKSPADLAESDWRRNNPRFQGENFARNLELVKAVERLAAARECTPAQIALAWLLAKGEDIVPIPGTRRSRRVEENAGAAEIDLAAEEVARLDAVFAPDAVQGTRYPEEAMGQLNR